MVMLGRSVSFWHRITAGAVTAYDQRWIHRSTTTGIMDHEGRHDVTEATRAEHRLVLSNETRAPWTKTYARRLSATDTVVVLVSIVLSEAIWYFSNIFPVVRFTTWDSISTRHTIASVVLMAAWLTMLATYGTRDARIIGQGSLEYKRVLESSLMLFGVFASVSIVLQLDLGRSFILSALPLTAGALLLSRWLWRRWLIRRRVAGRYSSHALLVGSRSSVEHLVEHLVRLPAAGYAPVVACVPGGRLGENLGATELPIAGGLSDVQDTLASRRVDCVIVTSSDEMSPRAVRELGWSLESSGTELIVAPALTDIAGPRMHTRPVAGLPLIHVESPVFAGRRAWTKSVVDRTLASLLLILLSPVMLAISVAVRATSPGDVLFRQQRVGLGGETFTMFKFRSMHVDAEARLDSLATSDRDAGNSVLFKMRNDPRVTRVGATLRRYSLDELPQLLNVINGTMSLVGPRPPLDSEVASYEKHNFRRFLVRPGITGLWQVSGRSDLSWEDSVRLDLYYVENWSILNDFILMARTARAVLWGRGAY